MQYQFRCLSLLPAAILLYARAAQATTIPRLSFEELTDTSELIVSGEVTKAWASWDQNHKYIWTHYRLSVHSAPKGKPVSTIEFAEPGGTLDGIAISIPGAVSYSVGENVVIFLQRMPNGYLRTTGWGQGKYGIDSAGRLHSDSTLRGADVVDVSTPRAIATSLRSLDGLKSEELAQRVASRVHAVSPAGRTQ